MEMIGDDCLYSFRQGSSFPEKMKCNDIRKCVPLGVSCYIELATKVAELQFANKNYVLLFRGQSSDYEDVKGRSSLKPSLLRAKSAQSISPRSSTLEDRFKRLECAESSLLSYFEEKNFLGLEDLKRKRILRWAIIQHYEICKTPLLDVTHSLRIAASFASDTKRTRAYLFVVGVPNLSGSVTASAEAGLQIIRLASVCPPVALRPHVQEGYLLGEYPDVGDYGQKELYKNYEIDFGRRLVAKFRFNPKTFWNDKFFPPVTYEALYPDRDDPLCEMTKVIKKKISRSFGVA